MTTIKLESTNSEVKVGKLPLKKYVELLKALEQLPQQFSNLESTDESTIIENIPKMVANSYDDIVRLVNIVTGLDKSLVEEMYLNELVEIVFAVIKENEFFTIADSVKKNMGAIRQKKQKS